LGVVGCSKNDDRATLTASAGAVEARVVYKDTSGRVVTLGDLAKPDGDYNWEVVGGKPIPPKAKELVKEFIMTYQKELEEMWETEQYR
jgi:hypothetical protein